jgi:hypothetical protein
MTDLKSPALIYAKGWLFLLTGLVAAGLLLAEMPTLKVAALLAITIWSFCRCYYFAFYVIEHYVDPTYKFAGLTSFVAYLLRQPVSCPTSRANRDDHPGTQV